MSLLTPADRSRPNEHSSAVETRWLLVILAVALLLRMVLACGLQYWLDHTAGRPFLIAGDAAGYWELGRKIAAGEEYALYEPPRRVLRVPGFPAVLAVAIRLAPPEQAALVARLLLAVIGTAACGLVWLLARLLRVPRAGLPAAAFCAVSPLLTGFSVVLLSETLFALCVLLSLCSAAWLMRGTVNRAVPPAGQSATSHLPATSESECGPESESAGGCWRRLTAAPAFRAGFTGCLIALATLVRPAWLLVAPLLGAAYLVSAVWSAGRLSVARAFGHMLVLHLALLVTLLPWALRNQRVTGHLVWTSLWAGPSLYDGLHPGATGLSDMTFFEADRAALAGLSEYEVDRVYRRRAVEFLRQHPLRAAKLAVAKQARYWSPWPNAAGFRHPLLRLVSAVFFIPLLLAAVYGAWQLRRQYWLLLLTAGPLLYFASLHTLFVGSLRYRLPAEYPLAILAAAGLLAWKRQTTNNLTR